MVKKLYINENDNNNKKLVKEGESYGWEVDSSEAWEAYDLACEYFGKEYMADQLAGYMGLDDLSEALAYIFRQHDFTAWKNRNEDEDFEESKKSFKRSRRVNESNSDILDKLGITEKELQIVKDFCDNGNANEEIGFESPRYGMVMITDIFRDEEGDPVIDTIEQAVDYYGLENVRNFCKKALRYVKGIKGESVEANTSGWRTTDVIVKVDGEPSTWNKYIKDYEGYKIEVVPVYNQKLDQIDWTVYLYKNGKDARKLEVFETSYDARDFADYEVYELYIENVSISRRK